MTPCRRYHFGNFCRAIQEREYRMASPVNRRRRVKAFERGFQRPQGLNPYRNAVLAKLWDAGRASRLAKTGGVMPTFPRPPGLEERRGDRCARAEVNAAGPERPARDNLGSLSPTPLPTSGRSGSSALRRVFPIVPRWVVLRRAFRDLLWKVIVVERDRRLRKCGRQ